MAQIYSSADLARDIENRLTKATSELLADGGRYFSETTSDLTRCRHGETGEYWNSADGELIEILWNNIPAILMALKAQGSDECS